MAMPELTFCKVEKRESQERDRIHYSHYLSIVSSILLFLSCVTQQQRRE